MIKLFCLIILFEISSSYAYAKEKVTLENNYKCVQQDKVEFCVNFENKPFSGKIERKDNEGNVVLRSNYKDGYKNGLTIEYKKGKVLRRTYYKKGLKNGEEKEFFENNVISNFATYNDGELSGRVESYDKNGDLIGRFRYKDGYLVKGFCQYKKGKNKLKKEITNSKYNQIINCEG